MKKLVEIPTEKLRRAPWNFKQEDDGTAERLLANLTRNGQIKNINVRQLDDGTYEVIDGNHRLDAFRALGARSIVCFDHGAISKEEAIRIASEAQEYFGADVFKQGSNIALMLENMPLAELAGTLAESERKLRLLLAVNNIDVGMMEEESKRTTFRHLELYIRFKDIRAKRETLGALAKECERLGIKSDKVNFGVVIENIVLS